MPIVFWFTQERPTSFLQRPRRTHVQPAWRCCFLAILCATHRSRRQHIYIIEACKYVRIVLQGWTNLKIRSKKTHIHDTVINFVIRPECLQTHRDILTVVVFSFLWPIQRNLKIVPQMKPWPFPSTSFPLHYSLIILPFDAIMWATDSVSKYNHKEGKSN
jgi:hypothetical protein